MFTQKLTSLSEKEYQIINGYRYDGSHFNKWLQGVYKSLKWLLTYFASQLMFKFIAHGHQFSFTLHIVQVLRQDTSQCDLKESR